MSGPPEKPMRSRWLDALEAPEVPPIPYRVGRALGRLARPEGVWRRPPTVAVLMARTGLAHTTVIRALRWLEDEGWLTVIRRGIGRSPTLYALTVPCGQPVDIPVDDPVDGGEAPDVVVAERYHNGAVVVAERYHLSTNHEDEEEQGARLYSFPAPQLITALARRKGLPRD